MSIFLYMNTTIFKEDRRFILCHLFSFTESMKASTHLVCKALPQRLYLKVERKGVNGQTVIRPKVYPWICPLPPHRIIRIPPLRQDKTTRQRIAELPALVSKNVFNLSSTKPWISLSLSLSSLSPKETSITVFIHSFLSFPNFLSNIKFICNVPMI